MSSVTQAQLHQITLGQLPPVSRILVTVALTLAKWDNQRRSRLALRKLDTRLLKDIGLDAQDQATESLKHFWQR